MGKSFEPSQRDPKPRPYPAQYVGSWTLRNGVPIVIRPIRPEDELRMVGFHQRLSDRSVYLRYFQTLTLSRRVEHERLLRICAADYDHEIVVVAEKSDDGTGAAAEIIAVGRISKLDDGDAEAAVVIDDDFQHLGLGSELFRRLIEIGRQEKVRRLVCTVLAENRDMRAICVKLGFRLHSELGEDALQGVLEL
jgi:acetyltransferase